MTHQDHSPEGPKRIEINVSDSAPKRVVIGSADLTGENAGRIILRESDFEPAERRPGNDEKNAKRIFKSFVYEHLPKKFSEISVEGTGGPKILKWRDAEYEVEAEGQLVPVSKVRFSEHKEGKPANLDEPPCNYVGFEVIGENEEPLLEIKYDDYQGFIGTTGYESSEIDPQSAVDAVAILTAMSESGDLKPIQPPAQP